MTQMQSEAPQVEASAKPAKAKTEYTPVTMEDGSVVQFAGKKKMLKKVEVDADTGAVVVKFLFRNGAIRFLDASILSPEISLRSLAHGLSQKIGDESSGEDDVDDMVVCTETMIARLTKGEWGAERQAGDSFAGSSIVIRALVTHTGKTVEAIKSFLQGKLDADKASGGKLTRAQLYASFRSHPSVGAIIQKLESEKASKAKPAVDAGDLLDELDAE